MNKRDLLLEIGLEEMPARFVTSSCLQLKEKVTNWLTEKNIPFDEVLHYSTPRRLAVLVRGVNATQQDVEEEAKGPAKKIALGEDGTWSKAALGFTRGQGVDVADIFFKEINGVEYAHVRKFIKGAETKDVLPELEKIVSQLSFPKNMRWANENLRYIRPIKWLVALFGNEVIPFSITGVNTSNQTMGHRFLGQAVTINDPSEYISLLLGQFVIADAKERKQGITSQIAKLEEEMNWVIPIDEELLEEVNNLVEYPTALFGAFEEEYLQLPEEVLITSMKEHQRYFPVKDQKGKLLPYFVTVRNGDHQHLDKVAKGNEKVLRARLSDAAFFYREDQKLTIDACLAKLTSIVYHEEIGTLSEKVGRVRALTNKLTNALSVTTEEQLAADRAAQIAKFDLVTHMVYEFPELQGFMGEKYAKQKGEADLVASAINEHYMPRNAEDHIPPSVPGAILSVAEKLDTILSFFAIGNIPSGSQDPYALRRQASGIVQILIQKEWPISLEEMIRLTIPQILESKIGNKTADQLEGEVLAFFKLRLKHYLQEQNIRHDLIDAVLAGDYSNLSQLIGRAHVLQAKKDDAQFKEVIESLSRVMNIASKATEVTEVSTSLFENEFESKLYADYQRVEAELNRADHVTYFEQLASLKESINSFFDGTMVMADDQKLRANRLSLMKKLSERIRGFAAVNEILTK